MKLNDFQMKKVYLTYQNGESLYVFKTSVSFLAMKIQAYVGGHLAPLTV